MTKYLYGASVQGIQGFIFETNKLKEIVGGSELIEQICTTEFKKHVDKKLGTGNFDEDAKLIMAAGNIKYLFDSSENCQKVINDFSEEVIKKAPGVTISQAVVKVDDKLKKEHVDLLEKQLKTERNKPKRQHGLGWMITERSRSTGKAGVKWARSEYKKDSFVIDKAQKNKRDVNDEIAEDHLLQKLTDVEILAKFIIPKEIDDIVNKQKNEWIAVVHADGNSLGKLIQQMIPNLEKVENGVKNGFVEFSNQLNKATVSAANDAFELVVWKDYEKKLRKNSDLKMKLPIRPVVIGGDDLTVIIRGDLAIDFTREFLRAFQHRTREYFKALVEKYHLDDFKEGLTACAGIAYIKPTYPFHYAVDLAEELCSYSKKVAKEINNINVPSCFTFHKVQSSFVEDYKTIKERELTAGEIELSYGPYAVDEECDKLPNVSKLKKQVKEIKRADSPKSNIRKWLSELHVNKERADQLMKRTINITKKHFTYDLDLNKAVQNNKTHLYDVLILASIEKK